MRPRLVRHRVGVSVAGALAVLLLVSISAHAGAQSGRVNILKLDAEDDEVTLPGARFELFRNAPPLDPPRGPEDLPTGMSCVSDSDGRCRIRDVPFDYYWIVETQPPDGYSGGGSVYMFVDDITPVWNEVVENDPVEENEPVNDPTGDTAAGDGTHIQQSGPSVAADGEGQGVIVAFNDTKGLKDGGESSGTGFAFSRNGGMTWTDGGALPTGGSLILGDPRVVYDATTGRFVVVNTGCFLDPANQVRCPPLVSSTPFVQGQPPFQAPPIPIDPDIPPFPALGHGAFMLIDNGSLSPFVGSWYVVWTRSNADGTSQVFLSRSRDRGATWDDPVPVSDVGAFDFASASMDQFGTIHIVWANFGGDAAATFDVLISTSTDGGATVSAPRLVAENVPKSGTPGTCDGQPARLYEGGILAQDRPQIAVNPQDEDEVVVVFSGQGVQPGDASDVIAGVSEDGGVTFVFSRPVAVGGEQTGPMVDVSSTGQARFLWFANMVDPGDPEETDLYVSSAAFQDIGRVSGELTRVNEVPSSFGPQDPPFDTSATPCQGPGAPDMTEGRSAIVVWTDGRDPGPAGNDGIDPNIYFADVETPRVRTQTTVNVDTTRRKLVVGGRLTPSLAGDHVTVLLFHDEGDGFDRIGRRRVDVDADHRYETSFGRPDEGRCRVVVKFAGTEEQLPSSARRTFAC